MKITNYKPFSCDFFLGATTSLGYKSDTNNVLSQGMQTVLMCGAPCTSSPLLASVSPPPGGWQERLHAPQSPAQIVGVVGHKTANKLQDATSVPRNMPWQSALKTMDYILLDASEAGVAPVAPCACEQMLSLYEYINPAVLHPQVQQIKMLLGQINCLQTRVARYVSSISGLLFDSRRAASCATNFEKITRYAARLCARELPPQHRVGYETRRFLSAITPQGNLCYSNTIQTLASRIIVFHDEYGAASKALFAAIRTEALARGYDIITCPCAMFPDEKIEHIIIPSCGLAFVTSNSWHPMQFETQHNIHAARFTDAQSIKNCRLRLRFNTKAAQALQTQCVDLLTQIETARAELRTIYQGAMDTAAMQEKLEQMVKRLEV